MLYWASLVAQMVKNLPVMQETWVWSLGWEDPLEKGMATYLVFLPGKSSWTEELGGLQSLEFQRVGHDWANLYIYILRLYIYIYICICIYRQREKERDFSGGSDGKASAYNLGDWDSIPGLGKSPGEGNGNPLQSLSLENPMDGGAWWATVHGVGKSQTRLSDFTFFVYIYTHTVCCQLF